MYVILHLVPECHCHETLPNMDPQEFEARYREQIRDILNRLQSAMVVSSELEHTIADIGEAVQLMSRDVERFLDEQRSGPEGGSLS